MTWNIIIFIDFILNNEVSSLMETQCIPVSFPIIIQAEFVA